MEEIEIGEYVRTKYGITQYREYETTDGTKLLCMPVKDGSQGIFANIEDVIKSSPNITDLIEKDDYVNGSKVVGKDNNCILILTDGGQTCYRSIFENKDIKSIVTKEQFNSIEYRLEE